MRRYFILFYMLISALFFTACEEKKKIIPSGKIVKVGILAPLSRENRKYGYQSLFGIEFANREKRYLSNGDEIRFEIVDTKSSPKGTQKALKKLLDNNVTAIISLIGSGNMLSLKEALVRLETPMLVPFATNDEIPALSKFLAQICMSNQREALVAAHYIKDEKFINRVGVLYNSNNPYSYALAKQFQNYFKGIRGEEAFVIDFYKQNALQKLAKVDLLNVGMIFSTLRANESARALKILHKKNVNILLSDGTLSAAKENAKNDLDLFNGAYIIEHYASDMKGSRDYKKLQKILKKEGLQDSSYAFLAYDAYQLLYYALQNCPKYEQQCINALFQNSDIIKGIAGNFSMENGKVKRKIYVDKIKNLHLKREIVTY